MDLMGKKAIWDRIWRLPSGRRSLYLIKNVFDKDLREFSDFGGLRVGYNGLGYIRVAELATTD